MTGQFEIRVTISMDFNDKEFVGIGWNIDAAIDAALTGRWSRTLAIWSESVIDWSIGFRPMGRRTALELTRGTTVNSLRDSIRRFGGRHRQ